MALRARIYAYNRHLSFDVAFICSTLTHCGVCDLSVWRLKWEVSYVHQCVWRWKWFSCQSSYVLQRLRLCRTSDTLFRREIDSRRQWAYGICYGDSFPAAKECSFDGDDHFLNIIINPLWCFNVGRLLICCFIYFVLPENAIKHFVAIHSVLRIYFSYFDQTLTEILSIFHKNHLFVAHEKGYSYIFLIKTINKTCKNWE